jgi:glyoxylase-like metal-dependent hydrolase (beta-lactamase superfamily II)
MRLVNFRPVKPDIILKEGDEIEDLRVIHTPGHTEGSICLFRPGKVIFTGDALLSDRNGNAKPLSRMMTLDMVKAKQSLKKTSKLEFDILLPGHGRPVLHDASQRVKHLLGNVN